MAPSKVKSEARGQRQPAGASLGGGPAHAGGSAGGEEAGAKETPSAAGRAAWSGGGPGGGGPNGGASAGGGYEGNGHGNGNGNGGGAGLFQARESLIDATAYPLLTEQINVSTTGRASGGDSGGFGQTVSAALRDVLGWQLREGDAKGFVGALTQSFALNDVEGHVEWKWTPRTYAVQTDLAGGITGAQASLLTRTKQAVDASLPLLDGLYPLTLDADPEDSAALRALVRGQMIELVNELGTLGGPRVIRVDEIFGLLLGHKAGATLTGVLVDPAAPAGGAIANAGSEGAPGAPVLPGAPAGRVLAEQMRVHLRGAREAGGTLGLLRDMFGLESGRFVNTVDEEQNLTNYQILADYLIGLERSWFENRRYFTRTQNRTPFFGTQLVLLSRQLSVIVESVGEVRFALDSVFIGALERQALLVIPRTLSSTPGLDFDQPPPPLEESVLVNRKRAVTLVSSKNVPWWPTVHEEMFVEELLGWIETFAGQEGPQLIQSGGKLGVEHIFTPTVKRLYLLSAGMMCPQNATNLPEGYFTPRVMRSFHELTMQLFQLVQLAKNIKHRVDLDP